MLYFRVSAKSEHQQILQVFLHQNRVSGKEEQFKQWTLWWMKMYAEGVPRRKTCRNIMIGLHCVPLIHARFQTGCLLDG